LVTKFFSFGYQKEAGFSLVVKQKEAFVRLKEKGKYLTLFRLKYD